MNKLLCVFAVSTSVALSGQAFADIQKVPHGNVTDSVIKVEGNLGLPGIYLWNITTQEGKTDKTNKKDKTNVPLTCGLYIMEHADDVSLGDTEPLTLDYTYNYDESKVILTGEMTVSKCLSGDESPNACGDWGDPVTLQGGDLVGFDNGDRILFSTLGYAKAYYCGKYPK